MKPNTFFALSILLITVLACAPPPEKTSNTNSENTNTTSSTNTNNAAKSTNTEAMKITAVALVKAYDENEINADKTYRDKLLSVTGRIHGISEVMGSISVDLDGGKNWTTVRCSFEENEKDSVAKLKKGQQATLIGTCDGMTGNLYVGLNQCKIQ